ncbi:EpsG family protein [Halobacillus alkaliphilus]|uniref:EpsG family protein n=1 Tax=Halobacillus alkaliphilus TaxID=396056 RepID=A0A1I2JX57_9BACI|nr:EpsG family protein [Halobacillus alkaliphilus]SFF58658.1 EpsG family protein [Halobacillus alkaliphilus]
MVTFLAMLLLIVLTYPYFNRKKLLLKDRTVSLKTIYIFLVSLMLIIILGLRGLSVGIDTTAYYNSFEKMQFNSLSQTLDVQIEHGYKLYEYTIDRVFGEFQYLLVFMAIFYISVVSFYIYKFSQNAMYSYLLFILFGFYTFGFSAIRQTIAIALIMIAFKYIIEKRLIPFLTFVLLASSFHITALIFLPSYWLNKIKLNRRILLLFSLIALIIIGLRNELFSFLTSYSKNNYTEIETGGSFLYLFILFSVIIGVIYRKMLINKNENNKYFFYMMITALLIMPVTQFHPAVTRLYYYFFIFMIIYVPNLFNSIDDKLIRFIGMGGYIIIGLYLFFGKIIYNTDLDNYLFFWQ